MGRDGHDGPASWGRWPEPANENAAAGCGGSPSPGRRAGIEFSPRFEPAPPRPFRSFSRVKIAILGGGISGTALARMLAADGHQVQVLEQAERAGGLCKSRRYGEFTFDEAGGHILFSKDQKVLDWQLARCGGEAGTVKTVRNTRIRWHDRWVPYPFENGVGHLTKDAIVDCLKGYIEAHVQRRLGVPCPTNFRDWILWRMGDGFARHFMVPYNEKIWKCDLATMSSGWVAGRVPEAPIEDILRSAIGIDTAGYTHQSVFWFPREGGFETLVRGTVQGGGFALRCGHSVRNVRRTGDHFAVDGEAFDLVVNTVPLPLIEPAFEGIPEAVRADIRALKPIALINLMIGVKLDEPLPDLSWIYLPFAEQGPTNRVTYFSNYSPNNAPAGHGSFLAEVTHRGELRPDREWLQNVVAALDRAGILRRDQVVLTEWCNNDFAYIDQNLEFSSRVGRVRAWFDQSGYITFGRFGRYEYHNSDQCVGRAMEVHQHIRAIAASGGPARPTFR
ncbi:MAG: FAD-dependent oxidoreductase [Planctomycetes bacterium]|nr:FAD-dependent oxidoreductase [Planctomycetota bacterium]